MLFRSHDMESGRAAGVWTAAALWGPFGREELAPAGPDLWLSHPAELIGLAASGSSAGSRGPSGKG